MVRLRFFSPGASFFARGFVHEMIYFTPQCRKRKAFFHSFFDKTELFYQRSREDEKQLPKRGGHQPEQTADQTEKGVQPAADPGTEQQEVPGRPQEEGDGDVQPHPAVPQDHGGQKEGQAGPQPEGQIQQLPEDPAGDGPAEQPEQVIAHPEPQAHPQAGQEHLGLGQRIDVHPRKRRPRKEPWRSSSSS